MAEFDGLKKGDTVFRVYDPIHSPGKHRGSEAAVKSVGPKWITVGDGSKFDRDSGSGDFGWVIYRSREAYEQHAALLVAWSAFKSEFGNFGWPSSVVSVEQIKLARDILAGRIDWKTKEPSDV